MINDTRGEEMVAELVHEKNECRCGGTSEEMSVNWAFYRRVGFGEVEDPLLLSEMDAFGNLSGLGWLEGKYWLMRNRWQQPISEIIRFLLGSL
jgi:hypothetical protein